MSDGFYLLENYSKNYVKWIFESYKPFLGKRILEIGSGTSTIYKDINDYEIFYATDINDDYIAVLQEKLKDEPHVKTCQFDIVDSDPGDLMKNNFDTIICISVLEHIRDDKKAIENMSQLLSKNGRLIIFAPAIKFLYGPHDKSVGHYRRYTKDELCSKIKSSDLTVEKVFYHNFPGVLAWLINAKILKKAMSTVSQVSIFDNIVPLFKFMENIIHPILGLNLLCIGKKE